MDAQDARITHRFHWVQDLALNDSNTHLRVHFLRYEQIGPKKTQHFTWITDQPLNEETVYTIMRGGLPAGKLKTKPSTRLKTRATISNITTATENNTCPAFLPC